MSKPEITLSLARLKELKAQALLAAARGEIEAAPIDTPRVSGLEPLERGDSRGSRHQGPVYFGPDL